MAKKAAEEIQREISIPNDDERWEEALECWDQRVDRDQARMAVDIFEELLDDYEDLPETWAWIARGYYWLGDSTRDKGQRKANFSEGVSAAKNGLALDKSNIPLNFWGASCLSQQALAGNVLKMASSLPGVLGMYKVVYKNQPDYFFDGLSRFMAITMAFKPSVAEKGLKTIGMNLTMADLLKELEESVERNPWFISNYVTLAEVCKGMGKKEEGIGWLEKGKRIDPDGQPRFAAENRLDMERIERRLKEW